MPKRKKQSDLSDLETENARLKRTISRLRKKLIRFEDQEITIQEEISIEKELPQSSSKCISCGTGELAELALNGNVYNVCKSCHWRKKIK
jgi:hypothetical protein